MLSSQEIELNDVDVWGCSVFILTCSTLRCFRTGGIGGITSSWAVGVTATAENGEQCHALP
eukprot:m.68312 g.68312  ORF g.68312 m.68312 type:complete len:61 (+) comp15984_c0_seq2:510-692(+)